MTGASLLFGCGRDDDQLRIAKVEGTVKFDGKPLANAAVTFCPEKGKVQPATGKTDANGHYDLVYGRGIHGAPVGMNHVTIRTAGPSDPQNERLAARYNSQTELTANVQSGENPPFDFDLTSH